MLEFEYGPIIGDWEGTLEIEDIGQCAIEASTALGLYSYLIIRTSLGTTQIFQFGPIIPDVNLLPEKVSCSIERIDWSSYKIEKAIDKFLSKGIVAATLLSPEEALNKCRDLIEYMREFDERLQY